MIILQPVLVAIYNTTRFVYNDIEHVLNIVVTKTAFFLLGRRSSVLEYDEISNWSYQDIASEEQLDTVTASEGALLNLNVDELLPQFSTEASTYGKIRKSVGQRRIYFAARILQVIGRFHRI
ncbi:unnamed protein product [Wuchereria bancrofti]|uniref:Uncharacterized protein n=1 Tax=Wuchereria bancrofti TaxID=6293 RepID=A0A3P7ED79_WUCBA|nr:unnamed protein product [Wuchereria bancrofti]